MSNLVFPNLVGLTYDSIRSPHFKTKIQAAITDKEARVAYQMYVAHHWEFIYEYLSATDRQALQGLFKAVQGDWDTFLYSDPLFNSVTAQQFAVTQAGDVAGTVYQITAIDENPGGPGAPELIQNFNGVPEIFGNGTVISSANYSISGTGGLTFNSGDQPASGTVLTWTGSFYYRCRFDLDDELDLSQMFSNMWEIKKVRFKQIKL